MTEQTDRESILRRVKKLLAVAQDSRANPHEAANAAAMAERMMRKYQIDNAELMIKQLKDSANFSTRDVFAKMKLHQPSKRVPVWAQWIAVKVAELHDCGARNAMSHRHTSGDWSACIRFYGFELDVELAAWTFDYLRDETIRATRAYNKENGSDKLSSNSFRTGFVTALLGSLAGLIREKNQENAAAADADSSGSTALLVVAKARAVAERFGEFEYDSSDSKARVDVDAYRDGVRKGRAVDVARRAVGTEPRRATLALNG